MAADLAERATVDVPDRVGTGARILRRQFGHRADRHPGGSGRRAVLGDCPGFPAQPHAGVRSQRYGRHDRAGDRSTCPANRRDAARVGLGLVVGDSALHVIRYGAWQIGLVVAMTLTIALLPIGHSGALVAQAGRHGRRPPRTREHMAASLPYWTPIADDLLGASR